MITKLSDDCPWPGPFPELSERRIVEIIHRVQARDRAMAAFLALDNTSSARVLH